MYIGKNLKIKEEFIMAGGPYNIPRNYKGEGKILYIFSTKGLIYTAIGIAIGLLFFYIFRLIGMTTVGFVVMAVFGAIGFAIATFKIPDTKKFEFTTKTGRREHRHNYNKMD
jgi:hypothetical protein